MKLPVISEITKYSRLAWDLRAFLKHKITLEESKRVIAERLQNRERNFLSLVEKGIYGNPRSPYLKLLKLAGCEFGDIEKSVNKDGIEATLSKLLSQGVYISWEEFKGKRDVVRGSTSFKVRERDFDNPYLPGYYYVRSSGSRSAGTRTMFDLGHHSEKCFYYLPMLIANNALDAPMGVWQPGLPSVAGIGALLSYDKINKPIAKWFCLTSEKQVQASVRDRLATRYMIYGGRFWGGKLVAPEYASLDQAAKVAGWMAQTKKLRGSCSLSSFVSPAVKVCQAAIENDYDIEGAHFFVGGEPLTQAKRQQIEKGGARVTPRYYITELGFIGSGCSQNSTNDNIHLFHDSIALIQHRRDVEHTDTKVNAFLFTSLTPASPKIMLNVESDDFGMVENRSCDCIFGELGFSMQVYEIRSFAKLTGIGMSIMGSDFVHILEDILPTKYGGVSTDYQLIEEEDSQGQTRLSLIISPDVGKINESDVIDTVLEHLRNAAYGGKLAAALWSQPNTLRIKRTYPISKMGKIATLHLANKQNLLPDNSRN